MTSLPLMAASAPPVARAIPIRNAWVARTQVRYFLDAVNDWRPYLGGTDLRVRFSQHATGFDFSGYPSTLAGPFAMIETADPGWYYAAIDADTITTALAKLVGQTIYQIVEGAYGTGYSSGYAFALTVSEPLYVIDPRTPLQT
jgi:hypothetical protein